MPLIFDHNPINPAINPLKENSEKLETGVRRNSALIPVPQQTIGNTTRVRQSNPITLTSNLRYLIPAIIK